jgi:hypothetical protein
VFRQQLKQWLPLLLATAMVGPGPSHLLRRRQKEGDSPDVSGHSIGVYAKTLQLTGCVRKKEIERFSFPCGDRVTLVVCLLESRSASECAVTILLQRYKCSSEDVSWTVAISCVCCSM